MILSAEEFFFTYTEDYDPQTRTQWTHVEPSTWLVSKGAVSPPASEVGFRRLYDYMILF